MVVEGPPAGGAERPRPTFFHTIHSAKPLKFEASVALYFLTLAWFWAYIPNGVRKRAWVAVPIVLAAVGIAEVLYIALQAGRGVASHFNEDTLLEAALFDLMGIGAVILTAGSLALGSQTRARAEMRH